MQEKRDKKGRKWRLVKPAYPGGTYVTPFFPHDIELHFPPTADLVAWEEYILSTGELVAFVAWTDARDGGLTFGFAVPSYLSRKGAEEFEALKSKPVELWFDRALALIFSRGVPRDEIDPM